MASAPSSSDLPSETAHPLSWWRSRSGQDFDRDAGKAAELGVVGQKETTTVLDGSGQVKRVERLELVDRTDVCGSLADCGRQGEHSQSRIVEDGDIVRPVL